MLPASLHNRGQLIYLSIKCWQARKLDKKATKKIVDESNATGNAARVNKYLMADEDADAHLRAIARIARKTRETVEEQTVPWNDAGMRLVSNLATFKLLGDLGACEQEFQAAVDAFLDDYDVYRAASLEALGDMANDEDYPAVDVVRTKFSMRTTLEPIPSAFQDDRTGLTDDERAMIDNHYAAVYAERMEDANHTLYARLTENLERYVERLTVSGESKPKVFTHTMVSNLRDTMTLFDSLGMFDSTDMAKLKASLEQKVCTYEAKDLRDSLTAASEARTTAQTALSTLRQISQQTALSPVLPINVAQLSSVDVSQHTMQCAPEGDSKSTNTTPPSSVPPSTWQPTSPLQPAPSLKP